MRRLIPSARIVPKSTYYWRLICTSRFTYPLFSRLSHLKELCMSLTNSQFHDLVDVTLRNLEDILDDNSDADIDIENSAGILTLTFANQHQLILSRQEPLKQ